MGQEGHKPSQKSINENLELEFKKNHSEEEYNEYKKMLKELKHIKLLPFEELSNNFNFYMSNYPSLERINKIIDNIKYANLFHLTPREVLAKLVSEEEQNQMNKREENFYFLPETWEDLFKLEGSKESLKQLFIQSEVERVRKKYSDLVEKSPGKWKYEINEFNYKKYDENYEEERKKLKRYINIQEENEKYAIKEIMKLKNLNLKVNDIRKNIDYYIENMDEFQKIDNIIENSKIAKVYNLKPVEVARKYDNINDYDFPDKWKDLFSLKSLRDETEFLRKATSAEKVKKKLIDFDEKNSDFYKKEINIDNYEHYDKEYNYYVQNKKRIQKINKYINKIKKHNEIEEKYADKIKEFKNNVNFKTKLDTMDDYENLFYNATKEIIDDDSYNDNDNDNNYVYKTYNTSGNSSNYDKRNKERDEKQKVKMFLCPSCRNNCIGCKRKLKGIEGVGREFFIHKKCRINLCYICGKDRNICEKNHFRLCKPCYHSKTNRFYSSLCFICHKNF